MRLLNCLSGWPAMALALLLLAAPAEARRVYEGEEAQALKCAWIIARTAGVLAENELITPQDQGVSIAISARILNLYVSGEEGQKLRALEQVGARRDTQTTVQEFQREAVACLRKFPVE